MVCSVDQLASRAGLAMIQAGGNAVDAAVAANAVLTVTQQQMCGLGGDLWALIHHDGQVLALNASGRAGSGADPEAMRAAGHTHLPLRDHVQSAPVPGCVDGWVALNERFGKLPLAAVLEPAIGLAAGGFAASAQLAAATARVADVANNHDLANRQVGDRITRPGVGRVLGSIAESGRAGFYQGEFGESLIELGAGEYTAADLAVGQADWVDPVTVNAWGHDIHTTPPNSQGYLSLAGAVIAAGLDLPADPADPCFGHLLIESARAAAFDRPHVLHEHADPSELVAADRLAERRTRIDPDRAVDWGDHHHQGDTMYLCTVDGQGMGVSLIQSNASGFGSHLVVGDTGIFLHDRGIGFSLEPGHPAEYGPGRRPPHTLAPALVTRPDGSLRTVLGTMGGDAQPQIVLQMLARLLHAGQTPGEILSSGRFALASSQSGSGFDTWAADGRVIVQLEPHAADWEPGLTDRGHRVDLIDAVDLSQFGHAHMIDITANGARAGAADPRAWASAALGY